MKIKRDIFTQSIPIGKKEEKKIMKKLSVNVEELPRELATEKSVCDIIKDYVELNERVNFKLVDSKNNTTKEFTLEQFKNEEDNLTRREFIANVIELVIVKCVVNTGRELAYQDEDGKQKTRIEKLPKYTNITMTI